MNKKASLQDLILLGSVALVFGIVILTTYYLTSQIDDKIQTMDVIPQEAKTSTTTLKNYYPGVIDGSFMFLFIGLSIVTLILAALVRIHPIFIPLFFIGLIIIVFISAIMSNVYQEIAANEILNPYADDFTYIPLILNKLPLFIAIIGTLLMIAQYKTWRLNQG